MPSPVMLRQIGNSSSISAYIRPPASTDSLGSWRIVGIAVVPIEDDRIGNGPFDAEERIVPAKSTRGLRREEIRHLIEDFTIVGQRLEPVRETTRDVQCAPIRRRQLHGDVLQVCPRLGPDVDDDVEHGAGGAAYELRFLVWLHLIMHPAERASMDVVRHAALHQTCLQSLLLELALA